MQLKKLYRDNLMLVLEHSTELKSVMIPTIKELKLNDDTSTIVIIGRGNDTLELKHWEIEDNDSPETSYSTALLLWQWLITEINFIPKDIGNVTVFDVGGIVTNNGEIVTFI